jgi:hypothetical protein
VTERGGVSLSHEVQAAFLWFVVLAVCALASPSGSARDEAFHMASIYYGRGVHPETKSFDYLSRSNSSSYSAESIENLNRQFFIR